MVPDGKTRVKSYKLQLMGLLLGIRRNFLSLKVLQHWNKSSRDNGDIFAEVSRLGQENLQLS